MKTHVVIVCGSRSWAHRPILDAALDALLGSLPRGDSLEILEGGAKGTDRMAREWAQSKGIAVRTFKAEWDVYGPAAGPIRNGEMMKQGPEKVLVFHEDFSRSKGSRDMVLRAKSVGVRYERWDYSSVRSIASYIP